MEINYEICNILDDKMMEYSSYVLLHRSIPDYRDGLKVSLRRILYTMQKGGMTSLTKSANVAGQVMKIHPHSSTYSTIVNMVQKDNHLTPFLDGKGAFAYHTSRDMQPASERYSEVKLSSYAIDMLKSLDKNIVDMIPTFDGTGIEPIVLPVRHPNILTHCQTGLGVGFSTSIPSFNLSEVCDATIHYIKNKEHIPLVPDFSTGGYIIKETDSLENINKNGRGSVRLRSKYIIEDKRILIKEIPYTTTREAIIEKLISLMRAGALKEVSDVKDTTDIKGMEIEITTKKGVDCDILMGKLYKTTPLESTFSANMNVLMEQGLKTVGVSTLIEDWIKWRKDSIKRVLVYDISKLKNKLHYLRGLEKCLVDIDKVINIIRHSKEELIIENLCKEFNIDETQAEDIANMKLRNINSLYIENKIKNITTIEKTIEAYERMASSDEELSNNCILSLRDTKNKYGIPRKTQIIENNKATTIPKVDTIEDFNCHVMISKEGYIKKYLRLSTEDAHKLKDGDSIQYMSPTTNKSQVVVLTNKANSYIIKLHELDTTIPSNLGSYLPTQLGWDKDEKLIFVESMDEVEKKTMLFGFDSGNVAKVPLSSYISSRQKSVNAYNTKDNLIYINCIIRDLRLMFISDIDKCIMLDTSRINPKASKSTRGFRCQVQKDTSKTIRIYEAREVEGEEYYCAMNAGVGKYIKKEHIGLI